MPYRARTPRTLVFDVSLIGFARWARKRLECLGYWVILPPYKDDEQIVLWAKRTFGDDFLIITTDKGFPCERKIVLPMSFRTNRGLGKPKYERLYTLLCVSLNRERAREVQAVHPSRTQEETGGGG